jgi:hypothetical protein
VSVADLLADLTQLTDLPVLGRVVMLAIAVSRGGLWLWLAAQRTVTAVAIERALRRELRSWARLPPR